MLCYLSRLSFVILLLMMVRVEQQEEEGIVNDFASSLYKCQTKKSSYVYYIMHDRYIYMYVVLVVIDCARREKESSSLYTIKYTFLWSFFLFPATFLNSTTLRWNSWFSLKCNPCLCFPLYLIVIIASVMLVPIHVLV